MEMYKKALATSKKVTMHFTGRGQGKLHRGGTLWTGLGEKQWRIILKYQRWSQRAWICSPCFDTIPCYLGMSRGSSKAQFRHLSKIFYNFSGIPDVRSAQLIDFKEKIKQELRDGTWKGPPGMSGHYVFETLHGDLTWYFVYHLLVMAA